MPQLTWKWVLSAVSAVFLFFYAITVFWSFEPNIFNVRQLVAEQAEAEKVRPVTGFATTSALIKVSETLLDKSGGYLSNDVMPPSVFMDNMPSWEFGALEMIRDMALALRKDFSRSQSQSVDNPQLVIAQPKFNIDSTTWVLPRAESEYRDAIGALYAYRKNMADTQNVAQFYARADNLRDWLKQVEKRLGSLSQRLSASVGQERINMALAGDSAATLSTAEPMKLKVKTSWWQLDDVFYETRGASWALLHLLKAVEIDFADVLEKKNAAMSVKQIIRELEQTQQTVWSPIILNGSGFGIVANHSLVMANYVSRANAALIDLTELLQQG